MLSNQMADDIRKQLVSMETKVSNLTALINANERDKAIILCDKQLKRTQNLLNNYDFEIKSASDKTKVASHQSQLKEFELEFKRLEKKMEQAKIGKTDEDLFKNRTKRAPTDPNSRGAMIQLGHETQEKGMQSLQRARQNVVVMNQQADTIAVQLDRQIGQMDKIYDDMNDTETTLKRAENHLRYFARSIYTDRIMICLIITIALAIIVIIGLAIAGKTPKISNTLLN